MKFFDLFKPKKQLSEADRKWNLMWDMWARGNAPSPYAELMNYEGEVNNGGHAQYFDNTNNSGDLKAEVEMLCSVLPDNLRENLQKGYTAFAGAVGGANNDTLFEQCDDCFYKNESFIHDILRMYADSLSL